MNPIPGAERALQLDFFKDISDRVSRLEHFFTSKLNRKTRLTVTRNRSHLITFKKRANGEEIDLRMQEVFLHAPPGVLEAISKFIRKPSLESRKVIRGFLSEWRRNDSEIDQGKVLRLKTQGNVYQLDRLLDEINREFFNGEIRCRITWGKAFVKKRRRSIIFGNYDFFTNLIKINPSLDQSVVPGYFIRYIVYHEMLHAKLDSARNSECSSERHHSREFYRLERQFPDYERCLAWEKTNLGLFFR